MKPEISGEKLKVSYFPASTTIINPHHLLWHTICTMNNEFAKNKRLKTNKKKKNNNDKIFSLWEKLLVST